MKDEIKGILNQLEIVARKHTIEVCEDGSKIETMPVSVVDELRLNNYSSKLLLDYITNLQEEIEKLTAESTEWENKFYDLQEELKEYKMIFDAFSKRPYAHRYLEEKKKELDNNKIIGLDSEMIYKDYYDLKEENERLHKELDYANNDNIYYIAKIDKAIDKLYCYGEVFDREILKQFQKEMLNILNGDDEE